MIHYSQDSISPRFRDSGCILDEVDPYDLPAMDVVYHDGTYYTLNNRTLYAWDHQYDGCHNVYVDIVKKDTSDFEDKFTTTCGGTSINVRCTKALWKRLKH